MGTEERIILAALRQFKENGFVAATTKAIAAEAGVAEVTLFRCFGDKQTLFIKTAAYIGEKFGLTNIPAGATGNFRQDMLSICQNLLRHFIRVNGLIRMLIFEAQKYEDTFLALTDIRQKAIGNIRQVVEKYPEHGGGRCMPACLDWLMSSLIGASLSYGLFHEKDDVSAFVLSRAGMIADAFIGQIEALKE
ncbi:MAG: TetR/AcrR family transcriptional regulator [Clostridiales bacterium]|nr:TetR/AcrR family transcriptional regulator [Clostridiales bacterium]